MDSIESENEESIRTFFAIEPDENTRDFLRDQRNQLKKAMPPDAPVRWARTGNLHLTLRFLGDTRTGDFLESFIRETETSVSDLEVFEWQVGPPSLFPNRRRPVVIAASVFESEPLAALAGMLDRLALRSRLAVDGRGFHPHVTLGRLRRGSRVRLPEFEDEQCCEIADSVSLMRGDSSPSGVVYSTVARFSLGRT